MTERRPRPGRRIERTVRWLTVVTTTIGNLVGAVVAFVLLVWVLPRPEVPGGPPVWLVLVLVAAYVLISAPLWAVWVFRRTRPGRRWLHEDRPPTDREQRTLLRSPLYTFASTGIAWAGAAVVFGLYIAVTIEVEFGVTVGITVLLAGLTTAVVSYLLAERLLRPAASLAVEARPLDRPALPGVTYRILIAWAFGSAIPILGIGLASLSTLTQRDFTRTELAVFALTIAGAALAVGFLATLLAARVTAAPVEAVRRAMADVEAGDFSGRVAVHDGTEVGMLQSGFNRMVEGLAERERIRTAFGQHVGVDVAEQAISTGAELGGEVRTAATLFVDVVGSTSIASERPATEVVDLLNQFFGLVVEVTAEHGGTVNKFIGDGAVVVFGAPVEVDDPAGRALAAARDLATRLADQAPRTPAAIGVAHGEVVAGNIGSIDRLEYTVIGDAVNEASRLTELAKERPGRVAASGAAVAAAGGDEASHWHVVDRVVLRGRTAPTDIAEPR